MADSLLARHTAPPSLAATVAVTPTTSAEHSMADVHYFHSTPYALDNRVSEATTPSSSRQAGVPLSDASQQQSMYAGAAAYSQQTAQQPRYDGAGAAPTSAASDADGYYNAMNTASVGNGDPAYAYQWFTQQPPPIHSPEYVTWYNQYIAHWQQLQQQQHQYAQQQQQPTAVTTLPQQAPAAPPLATQPVASQPPLPHTYWNTSAPPSTLPATAQGYQPAASSSSTSYYPAAPTPPPVAQPPAYSVSGAAPSSAAGAYTHPNTAAYPPSNGYYPPYNSYGYYGMPGYDYSGYASAGYGYPGPYPPYYYPYPYPGPAPHMPYPPTIAPNASPQQVSTAEAPPLVIVNGEQKMDGEEAAIIARPRSDSLHSNSTTSSVPSPKSPRRGTGGLKQAAEMLTAISAEYDSGSSRSRERAARGKEREARHRDKRRSRERDRDRDRDRDREQERSRDGERDRNRDRVRVREKEPDRERGRDRGRERDRERERDRDRDRGRERYRIAERPRERERDRTSASRERQLGTGNGSTKARIVKGPGGASVGPSRKERKEREEREVNDEKREVAREVETEDVDDKRQAILLRNRDRMRKIRLDRKMTEQRGDIRKAARGSTGGGDKRQLGGGGGKADSDSESGRSGSSTSSQSLDEEPRAPAKKRQRRVAAVVMSKPRDSAPDHEIKAAKVRGRLPRPTESNLSSRLRVGGNKLKPPPLQPQASTSDTEARTPPAARASIIQSSPVSAPASLAPSAAQGTEEVYIGSSDDDTVTAVASRTRARLVELVMEDIEQEEQPSPSKLQHSLEQQRTEEHDTANPMPVSPASSLSSIAVSSLPSASPAPSFDSSFQPPPTSAHDAAVDSPPPLSASSKQTSPSIQPLTPASASPLPSPVSNKPPPLISPSSAAFPSLTSPPPPSVIRSPSYIDPHRLYLVEEILDKRGARSKAQYLVRWSGMSQLEWVPYVVVQAVDFRIWNNFNMKQKLRKQRQQLEDEEKQQETERWQQQHSVGQLRAEEAHEEHEVDDKDDGQSAHLQQLQHRQPLSPHAENTNDSASGDEKVKVEADDESETSDESGVGNTSTRNGSIELAVEDGQSADVALLHADAESVAQSQLL